MVWKDTQIHEYIVTKKEVWKGHNKPGFFESGEVPGISGTVEGL